MFFASLKVKLPNMTDWHSLQRHIRKPVTKVGERTGEQSGCVSGVEADDVSSDQDLESSRLESFICALGAI